MYKENNKAYPLSVVMTFIYCIIIFALSTLFSCTTAKKATKYMNEHPETGAKYCADKFPVQEKTDSVVFNDTVYIDNEAGIVELNKIIDSLIMASIKNDTLSNEVVLLRERLRELLNESCPPAKTITVTKTITVVKEDSAKIYLLRHQLSEVNKGLQATVEKLDKSEKDLTERTKQRNKWRKWFWIIVILNAGWFTRKLWLPKIFSLF